MRLHVAGRTGADPTVAPEVGDIVQLALSETHDLQFIVAGIEFRDDASYDLMLVPEPHLRL